VYDSTKQLSTVGKPTVQLAIPFVPSHIAVTKNVLLALSSTVNCIEFFQLKALRLGSQPTHSVYLGNNTRCSQAYSPANASLVLAATCESGLKGLLFLDQSNLSISCPVELISSTGVSFVTSNTDEIFGYVDSDGGVFGTSCQSRQTILYGHASHPHVEDLVLASGSHTKVSGSSRLTLNQTHPI
jgi:hypothetical protein